MYTIEVRSTNILKRVNYKILVPGVTSLVHYQKDYLITGSGRNGTTSLVLVPILSLITGADKKFEHITGFSGPHHWFQSSDEYTSVVLTRNK